MKPFLLCLFAAASLALSAADEFVALGRAAASPVIDGQLDDAAWKNAVEITNFVQLRAPGTPAKRTTQVFAAYDNTNLYLAFRNREECVHPVLNRLHELKANCVTGDDIALWRDDIIEIFLAPDFNNAARYYHFAVNSKGTLYDAAGTGSAREWNSGVKTAARTFVAGNGVSDNASGWSVELAIPFAALNTRAPAPGTSWKANFCRVAKPVDEVSSWTQTAGRFHDPGSFGTLEFRNATPGVALQSAIADVKSGPNRFSGRATAPAEAELTAAFSGGEVARFSAKTDKPGEFSIPFTLDPANRAYHFTATTAGDPTETFLRSGSVTVEPGKSYTVSTRVRTAYKWNGAPQTYSFLTLVQKQGGYQTLPLHLPLNTQGEWISLQGKFTNKTDTAATLWGIKWTKRNLEGSIAVDDISMIEDETGRELFPNGDFSQESKNWNIFRKESLVPGYGANAEQLSLRYLLRDADGATLYRSPSYQVKIAREYSAIHSAAVQFGFDGMIPLDSFKLGAGAPERLNLLLKSDRRDSIRNATVELLLPESVRLLPPPAATLAPGPRTIRESAITRDGKPFRQYLMEFGPELVNSNTAASNLAACIPLFLLADTPQRGSVAAMEYRARIDDGSIEPQYHRLSLELLEPPVGAAPSPALPLVLWVYPGATETDSITPEQRALLHAKIADSGFNLAPVNAALAPEFRKIGIRPFPMLPSITISGPYFPYVQEFVRANPQYAGIDAYGKKTETIDPAVLLSAENPFRPYMEKVLKRFQTVYSDELHIDYEFGFMPSSGKLLPQGYAVIGYSPRNLELFRRANNITEELTPTLIQQKYAAQWLAFRNGQIADTIGLYAKIQKETQPQSRFSIYSGYPPQANEHYGIDWRLVSLQIDLCMAGYGGNDALMLDWIRQPFFNTGLLLMGYVDDSTIANTFGAMLGDAGSYMSYVHYTVDGGFFRNASRAAAIAADFEPFFLNRKTARNDTLTVDAETGKTCSDVMTFRHGEQTLILLLNRERRPQTYRLKTTVPPDFIAVRHATKSVIPVKNGTLTVTVNPNEPDAVLLCSAAAGNRTPDTPAVRESASARYPVLRWQSRNGALERYEIRYAATAAALPSARADRSCEPNLQVRETFPAGDLFWQVRALTPGNAVSEWSTPARAAIRIPETLTYSRDTAFAGSAAKLGMWQFYAWGGGSQFARFSVSPEAAPGDTASLRIDNEFDTNRSFWTLSRENGCHAVLPSGTPGKRYELSATLKASGETVATIELVCLDEQGKTLAKAASSPVRNTGWTPVKATLTLPPNARYLNCRFSAAGGEGSTNGSAFKLNQSN